MMSIQMQPTLSLHYSYLRCICVYEFVKGEEWQLLFVFVALYKLSRFMHTVSVNLYSSTQSCTFFFLPASADLHTWSFSRNLGDGIVQFSWSVIRAHRRSSIDISGFWMKPGWVCGRQGCSFWSLACVFSDSLILSTLFPLHHCVLSSGFWTWSCYKEVYFHCIRF